MKITLSKLNNRQYDYLMEIIVGCVEESLWETKKQKLDEVDSGTSSLSHNDCKKLLKKLEKIKEEQSKWQ